MTVASPSAERLPRIAPCPGRETPPRRVQCAPNLVLGSDTRDLYAPFVVVCNRCGLRRLRALCNPQPGAVVCRCAALRETRDKRGCDLRLGCAICVARQNDSTLQPRLETMPAHHRTTATLYSTPSTTTKPGDGPPAVDPVASLESPQPWSLEFQAHKQRFRRAVAWGVRMRARDSLQCQFPSSMQ